MKSVYTRVTVKVVFITLALLCVNQTITLGQSDSLKRGVKLSKIDQIWLAAYDDTTKALAELFTVKRTQMRKYRKTSFVVVGVSAATFAAGGLLLQRLNDPAGTYNVVNYLGIPALILGVAGIFTSGVSLGIYSLWINPYTIKKYKKLIEMHKSGKPLPEFYFNKIIPYLKRK